ncbi:MAG: hypothetical protein Q8936_04940 [Bacillota bacterium]|nr:hypothetical protein [Bacillota bacterium]
MDDKYAVILIEDEDSCMVKRVDDSTFEAIQEMQESGESDIDIIDNIHNLTEMNEYTLASGIDKDEAVEVAKDLAEEYVIINVY